MGFLEFLGLARREEEKGLKKKTQKGVLREEIENKRGGSESGISVNFAVAMTILEKDTMILETA